MREGGLEPPHLSAYAPEAYASTNFAIPATLLFKKKRKGKALSLFRNLFFKNPSEPLLEVAFLFRVAVFYSPNGVG